MPTPVRDLWGSVPHQMADRKIGDRLAMLKYLVWDPSEKVDQLSA